MANIILIVSIVAYFVLREIVLSSRENFAGLRSSFFFVCLFFLVRLNGLDLMRSIIWIKPWLSEGQMPLYILGCLL